MLLVRIIFDRSPAKLPVDFGSGTYYKHSTAILVMTGGVYTVPYFQKIQMIQYITWLAWIMYFLGLNLRVLFMSFVMILRSKMN